jgi:hypothetical protein
MVTQASLTSNISLGLGALASFGSKVDVVGIYANGTGNDGGASGQISSSIINSILGNTNAVASFGQMFANARPMKATIRETSKVMEHPVETGVILSDHHIINPVEIDIPLVVTSTTPGTINSLLSLVGIGSAVAANYAATYSQIRQAFINATLLSVKTNVGVFSNMIIADMPHEEDPEMFDVITIALHLKQVIYIVPGSTSPQSNYAPLNPANSNSLASGLQQAATLGTKLLAGASGISTYASVAGKGLL